MQHILNFYRYNSAIRKKYLDAIEKLPWQEIVKDRGASFHSIPFVMSSYTCSTRTAIGSSMVSKIT